MRVHPCREIENWAPQYHARQAANFNRLLDDLARLLDERRPELLIVDPAYLCLSAEGGEGNMFTMGALLTKPTAICNERGIGLMFCHHLRKNVGRDEFRPPERGDMAFSGFDQWSRQWLLTGRQAAYEDGSGHHEMWLRVGGSAGHSSLWSLDVDEGVHKPGVPRTWHVDTATANEARSEAKAKASYKKDQEKHERLVDDMAEVLRAVRSCPSQRGTKTDIVERSGRHRQALSRAFAACVAGGDLVPCDIKKSNRDTPYDGWRLADKHMH
jgi:hypothetical protein